MLRNTFKIASLVFLISLSLRAYNASAQIPSSPTNITITASATNPIPGQHITITAESYTSDIDASVVVWTVNGKVAQKGVGLTAFDFKTPALGKKTTIVVTATSPQGNQISGTLVINPSTVDMILETDGSAPITFLNKISPVYQNTVKVIAVPHLLGSTGKEYDPKTLVYTWRKDDGTVLKDQSGYGKQSVSIKGEVIPRPYSVIVDVASRDGVAQGQSLVDIAPTASTIAFFQNDPLYGPLYNRSLGDTIRIGSQKETSILASPIGLSAPATYTWSINNTTQDQLASKTTITLRAPENQAGVSNIVLNIQSPINILQQTKNGFTATFDTTGSASAQTSSTLF